MLLQIGFETLSWFLLQGLSEYPFYLAAPFYDNWLEKDLKFIYYDLEVQDLNQQSNTT